MSKQTNLKQEDILLSQTFGQDTPNSTSLITHEPIENTPFVITGNDENGYFIRIGQYRLTDFKKNLEEARTILEKERWEITMNLITLICQNIQSTTKTN